MGCVFHDNRCGSRGFAACRCKNKRGAKAANKLWRSQQLQMLRTIASGMPVRINAIEEVSTERYLDASAMNSLAQDLKCMRRILERLGWEEER